MKDFFVVCFYSLDQQLAADVDSSLGENIRLQLNQSISRHLDGNQLLQYLAIVTSTAVILCIVLIIMQ